MTIVHLERDASVGVLLTETFQSHTHEMQNLNFSFHQVDDFLSQVYQDVAFLYFCIFHPPGGRLLISRTSRCGICISCPCALPSMTYISFSTLFWWYTILCGIGIIVENEDAQNVIRCCLRSKMDRGNILLHFHPLWILQWRQKAQRAASGDAFEISYTYFSFCSWLVNF